MATGLQNLESALADLRVKIAAVAASAAPSYSIEGQSVDRMAYLRSLIESEKLLADAVVRAGGPFEVNVIGDT